MAKARAIVKRRKAVRNIRKITKTMQMIATAKFQKSLKRAVGTKPYTIKVRELVADLARSVGDVRHPLLRKPGVDSALTNRVILVVLTSNRGLAGAYNGSVLRAAGAFIRQQEASGKTVELYVVGKKGTGFFSFQKRPMAYRATMQDVPRYEDAEAVADLFTREFTEGRVDAVHVAYMNFYSTSTQKPEVTTLLPLSDAAEAAETIARDMAEREAQLKAGALDAKRRADDAAIELIKPDIKTDYEFSPDAMSLMDELLPLTLKTAFFQTFLDATTSEHVARMVAMKSATDNAEKMGRALTMQYNRARQSQITTELSEIMGGVEAMKG
jgi:F-type H+-transporting ATPase subunit gamma